jgi:hypothetical protein
VRAAVLQQQDNAPPRRVAWPGPVGIAHAPPVCMIHLYARSTCMHAHSIAPPGLSQDDMTKAEQVVAFLCVRWKML